MDTLPKWFIPGFKFKDPYINCGHTESEVLSIEGPLCKVKTTFTLVSAAQVINAKIMNKELLTEYEQVESTEIILEKLESGEYSTINKPDYLTAEEFDLQIP